MIIEKIIFRKSYMIIVFKYDKIELNSYLLKTNVGNVLRDVDWHSERKLALIE